VNEGVISNINPNQSKGKLNAKITCHFITVVQCEENFKEVNYCFIFLNGQIVKTCNFVLKASYSYTTMEVVKCIMELELLKELKLIVIAHL